MKLNRRPFLIAVVCAWMSLALSATVASARTVDNVQSGQVSDGVQMTLSAIDSNRSDLELSFRNVGDHDVTLNLGAMLANGKVQLPSYVSLIFTDAQDRTRVFKFADKKHPGVAGRLDDYVVPLRVGSVYTLKLSLNQFWCQETKEFEIPLLPGKNQLTAQFQGSVARLTNLDMPAIKLMNFWLGKVQSNTITIEP
jgi:hypothetical protein